MATAPRGVAAAATLLLVLVLELTVCGGGQVASQHVAGQRLHHLIDEHGGNMPLPEGTTSTGGGSRFSRISRGSTSSSGREHQQRRLLGVHVPRLKTSLKDWRYPDLQAVALWMYASRRDLGGYSAPTARFWGRDFLQRALQTSNMDQVGALSAAAPPWQRQPLCSSRPCRQEECWGSNNLCAFIWCGWQQCWSSSLVMPASAVLRDIACKANVPACCAVLCHAAPCRAILMLCCARVGRAVPGSLPQAGGREAHHRGGPGLVHRVRTRRVLAQVRGASWDLGQYMAALGGLNGT